MSHPQPIKVAIVGGGCAALSAAMELSHPKQGGRYDITVYQIGWRLGGKGASSRGRSGRIEEHGLHLWLGFYENAFKHMRECYAELTRDPTTCPIASFEQAFFADPVVSVAENDALGDWDIWSLDFPSVGGEPGTPLKDHNPYQIRSYFQRTLGLIIMALRSLDTGPASSGAPQSESDLLRLAEQSLAVGQLVGLSGLLVALELATGLMRFASPASDSTLSQLLERAHTLAHQQIEMLTLVDKRQRRLWGAIDVILATIRGIYRFGLLTDPRGFDAIDDYEFMDWLRINGALEHSVEAASIRACLYDLTFAYREGDPGQPAFAAGVALRCALRWFLTYRGAMFYKMAAGMGDVVFAPLYEVLRQRGVRFEFFHRLTEVELGEDEQGKHVSRLHFDVQAQTCTGTPYEPLIEVKGLPVWPDRPLYDQLLDGDQPEFRAQNFEIEAPCGEHQKKGLGVGQDFDFVVLGMSLDSVAGCCRALVEDNTKWRDMVSHGSSVGTQALQLWLRPSLSELGYCEPRGNLSGFVTPFDTWADMSHLVPLEDWQSPPSTVAYFCSALPDTQQEGGRAGVQANARSFIYDELPHLWPTLPAYLEGGGLYAYETGTDERPSDELSTQYFRANAHGSERYVQTLPGTTKYRLSPLDRSYDNLTVAGDWTANGLNAGCVEAAVMSGMLAAHALSGLPKLEEIVGYDHP